MNCPHYTPGYLSLSRANLSWQKNNFQSFPHISSLSTPALLKNWGIVFLAVAPRPAFSSNHTPQSVGRKLATLRERTVRIRKVAGSIPVRSTKIKRRHPQGCLFYFGGLRLAKQADACGRVSASLKCGREPTVPPTNAPLPDRSRKSFPGIAKELPAANYFFKKRGVDCTFTVRFIMAA